MVAGPSENQNSTLVSRSRRHQRHRQCQQIQLSIASARPEHRRATFAQRLCCAVSKGAHQKMFRLTTSGQRKVGHTARLRSGLRPNNGIGHSSAEAEGVQTPIHRLAARSTEAARDWALDEQELEGLEMRADKARNNRDRSLRHSSSRHTSNRLEHYSRR